MNKNVVGMKMAIVCAETRYALKTVKKRER